ncbi:MAG: bifunctional phosphopantothenoylcysteine decarboxylase/phosphopantothenate--cysteine ligase CoaBC [Bacteroidales bacterium]|nr:bifunctional phosphopantothenoylcysteine decarboxylase/phosphopantothenate--cysteine ligase CoaBC [Bacteroidales bacterium]
MKLAGKRIILGVTGSIAAYKAVYLLRLLMKEGADVQVIMTPAAREFVGPVTFSALSGKTVLSDFFSSEGGDWNSHVEMGVAADLMLVAPVTATTLGKMANGVADNLLVTTYLSARCPVVVAPAMDMDMYRHPSTQRNLDILKGYGNIVIEPGKGELASGLEGPGRMEEPEEILKFIRQIESEPSKKKLLNKQVLVTAGPTHENIDPVRFIGNHSSGKMGFAIAEAFAAEGAKVYLVTGPVSQKTHAEGVKVIRVTSAGEMFERCSEVMEQMDIAVFNAAVSDFTPVSTSENKVKRGEDEWTIRLKPTKDIAAEMGRRKSDRQLLVGFALETDNELENARLKMKKKNLDLVVLNSLQDLGAGFGTDTNRVTMIDRLGNSDHYELKPKAQVAADLVQRVIKMVEDA